MRKSIIFIAVFLLIISNIVIGDGATILLKAENIPSAATSQKHGNVLELSLASGTYNANSYLEILEDPTASLSLADICSPKYDTAFKRFMRQGEPNFGFTSSAYWVRLRLRYTDTSIGSQNVHSATNWFLSSEYPLMDDIRLYSPVSSTLPVTDSNETSSYFMQQSGDNFPFSLRAVEYRMPNFQLPEVKNTTYMVYLRMQTRSSMHFPIIIRSSRAMSNYIGTEQFILGIFYGLLTIVLCYNLLMYLSLRDANFGYYILYIASFGIFLFTWNGLDFQYFWPNYPAFHNRFSIVILGLSVAAVMQFGQSYMNTVFYTPRIHTMVTIIKMYCLVVSSIGLFWQNITVLGFRLFAPAMVAGTPFAIIGAVIIMRKGYRPARYFLAAWCIFLSSIIIGVLRAFSIMVPNNILTLYSIQIGSSLEMLCLSFGLADRLNIIRQEKKQAQEELIAVLQSSEQELEQTVEERTAELVETNMALEEANRFKTQMLSIAAHDLKNPLGQIMGYADLVEMELNNPEAAVVMLRGVQRSASGMLELVKNILDSAAMELGKIHIFAEPFSLSFLLAGIYDTYNYQAIQKEQTIVTEINDDLTIDGDAGRLRQVFDNLLSNAVKYSPTGKRIWFRAFSSGDNVRVEIQDEGPGLTEEDKAKLFGFFQRLSAQPTGGESSNGVGLAIVKKIVDLHDGRIWVESEPGHGAMFVVELPKQRR